MRQKFLSLFQIIFFLKFLTQVGNMSLNSVLQFQKVCPEKEWDTFMKSLRENLPTAFRITGSKCEAAALMKIVQSQYFSEILNIKLHTDDKEEGEEIKPINLSW